MSRYARRAAIYTMGADSNAGDLYKHTRASGCSVDPIAGGNGRPDWLVGGWGVTVLAEVKPPRVTGEVFARESSLRKSQKEWRDAWRGAEPFLLRTREDVDAMVAAMRKMSEALEAIGARRR